MHSCNHSCSPWIRIRIEELLHYSRGPHQNMFLERSWNRMNESTWRTLMLCLQSGGQSMPPMLSEWNSGTQRSASTYPLRYFDLACAKKIKVSMPTAIRFIAAYFTRVEQEVRWAAVDSTHSTAWINHIVPFVCDNLRAHHQWFVYQLALPSKNIHIICSFEHWLFIWSFFVQCSIVLNDTWYKIPRTPANRDTFVKPISCVKNNTHQLWRIEYNTSIQAVQASNTS